jgi:hypothetical protein|tara:strand:- start:813 stop:1754 length:942 start_codon:yes stop_codon:yes gene_type:complete
MTGIHQLLFSNFAAGGVPTGEDELNASGGNETKTIGIYKYHVFTSSGDFTVTGGGKARVVAIGGGGGGGQDASGGGGAGEVDDFQELLDFDSSTTYKVLIGAGNLSSGSNTTISAGGTNLVVSLGGGEGGNTAGSGADGGSGGGEGASSHAGTGPGAANGDNTNAGGEGGPNTSPFCGGGGGAATQAGFVGAGGSHSAGSQQIGGAGGEGIALTAIDTNLAFADFSSFSEANSGIVASGGGAGSNRHGGYSDTSAGSCAQGGTGGGRGGKAAGATTNINATGGVSFGSGGGGAGFNSGNGSGADGLVIIRYAA